MPFSFVMLELASPLASAGGGVEALIKDPYVSGRMFKSGAGLRFVYEADSAGMEVSIVTCTEVEKFWCKEVSAFLLFVSATKPVSSPCGGSVRCQKIYSGLVSLSPGGLVFLCWCLLCCMALSRQPRTGLANNGVLSQIKSIVERQHRPAMSLCYHH